MLVPAAAFAALSQPRVLAVEFDNDVNPVIADYAIDLIERANEENHDAVVILLDTPGGLASAMKDIYEAGFRFEGPGDRLRLAGRRASSFRRRLDQPGRRPAGHGPTDQHRILDTGFSVGGEDIQKDLRNKVVNDAAASCARSPASTGGTWKWVGRGLRRGANLSAREALQMNVIDVIAPDLPTLLNQVDGHDPAEDALLLETAGAKIDEVEMSFWKRTRHADRPEPDRHPHVDRGARDHDRALEPRFDPAGDRRRDLADHRPLRPAGPSRELGRGAALTPCRRVLFVAEMFVVSHGALALAGAVAFVIGSLMLFDPAGESYQVSLQVALGVAATMALMVGLVAPSRCGAPKSSPARRS